MARMGALERRISASYPRDPRYPRLNCFVLGTRRLESQRYHHDQDTAV